MKAKTKTLILLLLIVVPGVFLDQITKLVARRELADGPKVLISKVLNFELFYNTGAVWGSFKGKTIILALISVLIIIPLLFFMFKMPFEKKYYPLHVCFSFITAGAIGNLIDRIYFKKVTDFIYFCLINFPIFNVADIYVTCSVILMAVLILFYYKDEDFEWLKCSKN